MQSTIVLNQVIILFIIIGIGFLAKKKGIIDGASGKKFSELLLMVVTPATIISSFQFQFSKQMLINAGYILAFALAVHSITFVIGIFLYRKYPVNTKNVLRFITVFSNCGFMGFPVVQSLYGKTGVFYTSIYVAVFHLFVWTAGIMIFSHKKGTASIRKAFLNPAFVSVFVGMLIFLFSIKLPTPLAKAVDMVGSMNSPLAMLIIGSILAGVHWKDLLSGYPMYYGTAIRNLVIPLLAIPLLKLIGLTGAPYGVCVTLVAMPAAANTAIFAEMYDGDAKFASKLVAFSTLLSIVTIPLILMVA